MTNFYGGEIPQTVSINGQPFIIDMSKYRSNGVKRLREGVVTSGETNDQLLSAEGGWWRYRYSWHLGAGQQIDELDPESSNFRFLRSFNMNVWDKYEMKAFPIPDVNAAEYIDDPTGNPKQVEMVASQAKIYLRNGKRLYVASSNMEWARVTIAGTNIADDVQHIWTDGLELFVHSGVGGRTIRALTNTTNANHTSRALTDGTTPVFNDSYASAIINNRFIVASDNKLFELFADKTAVEIYAHYQPEFRWTVIFGVGSRTYAGGYPRASSYFTQGTISKLFNLGVTTTGDLFVDNEATTFLPGEELLSVAPYTGNVIFGMSKGIRFAVVSGDGTFSYGPLISAPGGVRDITIDGKFAWFTWTGMSNGISIRAGVGRLSVEEFTSPLAPAYAADIAVDGTILGSSRAVCRFNNITVFVVGSNTYSLPDGDHDGRPRAEAILESEAITFGTVERKSIMQIALEYQSVDPLEFEDEAQKIRTIVETPYLFSTPFGPDGELAQAVTVDPQGPFVINTLNRDVDRVHVRIQFDPTGASLKPTKLTSWRMRGYVLAPGVQEWIVPLVVRSNVIMGGGEGQEVAGDVWAQVNSIRDLWRNGDVIEYVEGDHSELVRIDNFEITAERWGPDNSWFEVNCTVRLLSV